MKATSRAELRSGCHQRLGMFGVATTAFGNRQVQADLFPSEAPFERLV
jgi:hypothetical protein